MNGPNEKAAGLVTQAALDTSQTQANPTEHQIVMQPCRQLFAELATDNLETAKRLSAEICDVDDEREKQRIGKLILNVLRMSTVFSKSSSRVLQ